MVAAMALTRTVGHVNMCRGPVLRWTPSQVPKVKLCRGLPGRAYSTTNHSVYRLDKSVSSTGLTKKCIHIMPNMRAQKRSRCFASTSGEAPGQWDIKMLYDGDCPLCMREVNMLRKRDKDQNKIGFVDISSPDYTPKDNAGISYEQAMGTIHGILPGDKIITNVDVFRKLYETVGLGWVYAITRFGPINNLANRVYALWAKYRLPITGRPDIETVLRQKKETCRGSS